MAIDILNRKNGRTYRARILLPGGRRISKCFDRKVDAVQFEAEILAKGKQQYAHEAKRILFSDFLDLFLKNHCSSLEFGSKQRYECVIRLEIRPRFGERFLNSISTFDVAEYCSEVKNSNKSDSSKHFVFTTFKTILKKAQEWGYIPSIPGTAVKPPRKGRARVEYWTQDEILNFLSRVSDSPRFPLYLIALNTGMRAGEILGLKKDALDFERNLIHIRRSFCQKQKIIKETTKTHKDRYISMNQAVRNILLRLKLNSKSEELFTPETLGCVDVSHLARTFKGDCKAAGTRAIRFHDLRHTFATQFVTNGGSIFHLASILGHSTTAMTARYAHFCIQQAREVAGIVNFDARKDAAVIPIGQKVVTL